jgi:glutamine amidotransferase-like uncharacterized protein
MSGRGDVPNRSFEASSPVFLCVAWAAGISSALTACRDSSGVPLSSKIAPILLFDGVGTSANDVAAIKAVLGRGDLAYSTADSSQLNDMSPSRLGEYRLLIVPGGNFIAMGKNLGPSAAAKIHDAIQGGLSYLGVCAGGFLAGDIADIGLNLTSGVKFKFYAAEEQGIRKAAVAIVSVGAPTLEQYWEDGPQFTGWGAAVGRYPDGTPAIVEGTSGKGWVILSGVHPEAPVSWRRGMTFTTPVSADEAYAAKLISAALNRTWLPHD